MVCSSHLKIKYVRFLIKYHLFILGCIFIMTSICIIFSVYKRDQIHNENLLRGFQTHGTKSSDDYRKLISLIRETQTTHLYPHTINSKLYQQTPYSSFEPHINPCSKRFYLSSCPILPYTELVFEFNDNHTKLFDNLNIFKSVCKLEWNLRSLYTNCSTNHSCCQFIGPVGLLLNEQFVSSEQCDNITENELNDYNRNWFQCKSSLCMNSKLEKYLTHIESSLIFKIYISFENNQRKLLNLYDSIHNYKYENIFYLKYFHMNFPDEEIILKHYIDENHYLIYITICLYMFCLILFVKNLFFVLTYFVHLLLTIFSCFIIYYHLFHYPITILNYTSLIFYIFLMLIDGFLWYTCWLINKNRRDDCTMQRTIENLLTQMFFYLTTKTLTAIITFVITYTNQIITLQCFVVFSFLLISISFLISFILYPASFIFIIRYQSSIPTVEYLSHRYITSTTNYFIHRLIPYLIIRLKVLWLILFTIISCLAFVIIFQWPKLQFNVCRLAFDTLPYHLSSNINENSSKILDIDVTYYIGSHWEVPNEPLIPAHDIPILDYNFENKMTSTPDQADTFAYALKQNLSELIQFCLSLTPEANNMSLIFMHNYSTVLPRTFQDNTMIHSTTDIKLSENLKLNHFSCFGDLTLPSSETSLIANTKFSSFILYRSDETDKCILRCSLNTSRAIYECILCLNSLYYISNKYDDLFLIRNGLRFMNDGQNPRYLFQTINYKWFIETNLNDYTEWQSLVRNLRENFITKFYSNTFTHMSLWSTSELFSSFTIMEQLQQEKYFLIIIKFLVLFVILTLFTGILGVFVTLTTLFNFLTCMAVLTLLNYKLTIENLSYFVITLIFGSQYSIFYSISYKLAPTFFFQRENRTMQSLNQLCTTLFQYTLSIIVICSPCLFSSLPYLTKSATVYLISSIISLTYSTLFLQSLLCFFGPADRTCSPMRWRCFLFCNKQSKCINNNNNNNNNINNNTDILFRNASLSGARRHQRTSTSSYFASSYFSQVFTNSTYFDSEYGGLNDSLTLSSRRRESSRNYQASYLVKRASLLTGDLIELYTPRTSLSPNSYNINSHRNLRQSSVARGVSLAAPSRPLYISPSGSPYSQLSIHSQGTTSQQCSPSPHIIQPSRSPSPHIVRSSRSPSPSSLVPSHVSSTSTARTVKTNYIRPCHSAPRLYVPIHRTVTTHIKLNDTLFEETPPSNIKRKQKTVMVIQRQNALSSTNDVRLSSTIKISPLSAAARRNMLKETVIDANDGPVWLKRSSSS